MEGPGPPEATRPPVEVAFTETQRSLGRARGAAGPETKAVVAAAMAVRDLWSLWRMPRRAWQDFTARAPPGRVPALPALRARTVLQEVPRSPLHAHVQLGMRA